MKYLALFFNLFCVVLWISDTSGTLIFREPVSIRQQFLDRFSVRKSNEPGALIVEGENLHRDFDRIESALVAESLPVIFLQLKRQERDLLETRFKLPIRHETQMDSEILLIDTFEDEFNGTHYRLIHLPAGHEAWTSGLKSTKSWRGIADAEDDQVHVLPNRTRLDARALDNHGGLDSTMAQSFVQDVEDYLRFCGGASRYMTKDTQWKRAICLGYIRDEFPNYKLSSSRGQDWLKASTMTPPESGAVWRELIETTHRFWSVDWGQPFPFEEQAVNHRFNTYWYLYLQAPPHSQMYYAFLLVDSMHNPNTQLVRPEAVGFYLGNLHIRLHAEKENAEIDPDNLYWIKSSPSTQNTEHHEGRSWSSTDSYSVNVNLGFKGKVAHGDINFNYTHTFTASYTENRDITDWSIIENTHPVESTGVWHYFQQWPVDLMVNRLEDFPRNWEQYYAQSWNPCVVKDVPHLSKFSLKAHNSMVWGVTPALRSRDGKKLPIRFRLSFVPTVFAHTCEIYDGHHKLGTSSMKFDDMAWLINVADLNNIQWAT